MDQKITINQKVATFIKEKRLALGMSQQEFAEHVFNDPNKRAWITKIEGGRKITLDTVQRIFNKINADIDIIEQ